MPLRALVTGVTGQDGRYLAQRLRSEGSLVYGVVRRSARDTARAGVPDGVEVIEGDVRDPGLVARVVDIAPDEIYNLAAFSHVGESFDAPTTTMETNTLGALHMLEAARICGARLYQASTSEMFGNAPAPQSETTPFDPRSPYAVSKVAAHILVRLYREAHDVWACSGILFNHESPYRGADFVTQKVCRAAAAIAAGEQDVLELGNLDARRDWGHARDYVVGMVRIMRHRRPEDFVLATGISRSVRDLLDIAFRCAGISDWRPHVRESARLYRPAEVDDLRGDATKAEEVLSWRPVYRFEGMIREMVDAAALPARHINVA